VQGSIGITLEAIEAGATRIARTESSGLVACKSFASASRPGHDPFTFSCATGLNYHGPTIGQTPDGPDKRRLHECDK
jgi:hypothetical protein